MASLFQFRSLYHCTSFQNTLLHAQLSVKTMGGVPWRLPPFGGGFLAMLMFAGSSSGPPPPGGGCSLASVLSGNRRSSLCITVVLMFAGRFSDASAKLCCEAVELPSDEDGLSLGVN